jgi:hypothetical protein
MFYSQDYNINSFKVKLDAMNFNLEQDVRSYREYASEQRAKDEDAKSTRNYRSFAIIPDIVAIDILTKYGIDIHHPDFMNQPELVRRFKSIIHSEYPLLLTSNIKKV